MTDFAGWLGDSVAMSPENRAVLAWSRILDTPKSVVFKPPASAALAAQTVRIEVDNRASVVDDLSGGAPKMGAIIYGVRDHPLKTTTVPDTVMKEGYRFIYNDDEYRIDDIILTLGEIQGIATAIG
jgi:hypothetical protein